MHSLVVAVDRCGQQNRTIYSACELCSAIQSKHKQVFTISYSLVVLTACSDVEMLKSGIFCQR